MRSIAASFALAGLLVLTGCQGSSIPLTPDDRDEEKDRQAKIEYYESHALTYYEGRRYEDSVEQWDKVLLEDPNNKKAKWGKARALYGIGSVDALRTAEAYYKEIVGLDWTHPEHGDRRFEVQKDYAQVYSALADYYDRDVRLIQHRLAHNPNIDRAEANTNLSIQTTKRNDLLRKAVPIYERVLATSKENQYALAGLAKAHLQLGNDTAGLDYAKRYIELSRRSQQNWKREMDDWIKTAGTQNVTRQQRQFFLEKMHGAAEKEKKMHLLVGSVHMRRDEFGSAVREFSKVIEMDSAVPAAYVERAQAYANLHQYSLAVRDLEQYLKITDPATHRDQRINAADLLDKYKRVLDRTNVLKGSGAG